MVNTVSEKKMRAQDVIRAVLDMIDTQEEDVRVDVDSVLQNEPGEQTSRFKQIFHLLSQRNRLKPYSNSPRDAVADVDAVTTLAGGGVNGPKHPADIRVKDPTDYPAR